MSESDREASVKRTAKSAADRLVYDADLSATYLDQIECGVVSIHAFWSAPSHNWLQSFAESLVRLDPERDLSFTICNIDDIAHLQTALYDGDTTGGACKPSS